MQIVRKILLTFCIIVVLFSAFLTGAILYYYYHPHRIKALVERTVSSSTGTSFTIKDLSYSIRPLRIHAKGVVVKPGKNQYGFRLEVADLMADISLPGPFGHRSLSFKYLKIIDFSTHLSGEMGLPETTSKVEPAFLARVLRRMIALFLFREVRLEGAEVVNGEIVFSSDDQEVHVSGIRATLNPDHLVDISCSTQVQWPLKKISLSVPCVHVTTDRAISLVDPRVRGLLSAQKAVFKSPHMNVNGMEVQGTLVYDYNDRKLVLDTLDLHMSQAALAIAKEDYRIDDVRFQLRKGSIDAKEGFLFFPEIHLTSSLLQNLRLSLKIDEKEATMELKGEDIHLFESGFALNLLPAGWQLSGLDSLHIRAVLQEKGRCTLTSKLAFTDLSFQNRDSSCMGEGLLVKAETDAEIHLSSYYLTANTTLKVCGGEILYDRYYQDLGRNPFSASLRGVYDIRQGSLRISNLRLGLKDILGLDVAGTILCKAEHLSACLTAKTEQTALRPLFHHFVSEPFQTEKPFLGSVHVGGFILADLKLTGTGTDWIARGNCTWREGELSSGDDGFSFQGIDLNLPVWYQSGKGKIGKETARGRLSISSMSLPPLPGQAINIPFQVGPNRLSVRSPTILRIPGGNVQVGPLAGKDVFSSRPSVETSLTMNAIDINPLLSGIWSQPIQGTMEGKLDPIRFEGDTISSCGKIRVKALNGEIVLSDLGASGIFTSTPVLTLSAWWTDLSLAKLTAATSFGKIEGVLNGHIKGLEIAHGQPQRFDLFLETVKKRGVSQRISVKAVDSIAQIGEGQSPFMGVAGGVASFFKEFPYKKIGVKASLKNDVFRINGAIREGGQEYLVKRGGISGVNVVNQNPDNRVSFKDMVKRIKRVTAAKHGPVVE